MRIFEVIPTPVFATLRDNRQVIQKNLVLPAPELSIQQSFEAILKTFENVGYIGELRQRWYEIKKLLAGSAPEAIPAAMQA